MDLKEYYQRVYRLAFINRYTNVIRIRNEDVAQHSFFVAAIVLKLHDKYDFDLGVALQAAISHDITEADLSDVTHDVKRDNPGLKVEISIAEAKVIGKYPEAVVKGFMDFENTSSLPGKVANLADVIQVQQYIDSEISLGNLNVDVIRVEAFHRREQLEKELSSYERSK